MELGFIRACTAVPFVKIADCVYNADRIMAKIQEADNSQMGLICFPELSITASTCGDLFFQQHLLREAENQLFRILSYSKGKHLLCVVGMPLKKDNRLYNVAVIFQNGHILGVVPKTYLNNQEKRWFSTYQSKADNHILIAGEDVPFGNDLLFKSGEMLMGVELGEDFLAPIPPCSIMAAKGANLICNLSSYPETIGNYDYIRSQIAQQSSRCKTAYIYASSGIGESSTDYAFAGNGFIYENGEPLAITQRFAETEQMAMCEVDINRLATINRMGQLDSFPLDVPLSNSLYRIVECAKNQDIKELKFRAINPSPFVPTGDRLNERCQEVFNIQVTGLAQRLRHTKQINAVVGISGGLDSTLALLVVVETFDRLNLSREGIYGITMPGFGTTNRTYNNAVSLIKSLGCSFVEIPIRDAINQHFKDIGHDPSQKDVVYENAQARERTQILMDFANQTNAMVIGTGDLSELALGWATFNGDHMSMYGVNGGVPKTLVKSLVAWIACNKNFDLVSKVLMDIVDTPVSPELLPADDKGNMLQKTEDIVGPYQLHDFVLYHVLRYGYCPEKIYFLARTAFKGVYDDETIKKWMKVFYRRFFAQQFKRSCLPDGPKIGSVGLSPRGDWNMPSDACSNIWLEQVENI